MSMQGGSAPLVNRWTRYGKDRLYVSLRGGEGDDPTKVGWFDLQTQEHHPEAPELEETLRNAVIDWRSEHEDGSHRAQTVVPPSVAASAAMAEDVIARPTPSTDKPNSPSAALPWHDLARNRPGETVRMEARSKLAEAPVKSTLARVLGVHTEERAWRLGADGEELVAAQIGKAQRKDSRWRVLHSIPVGSRGSDIDHLLIGPGGVFTVNAKHHPKAKIWVGGNTLLVDGHRTDYIRNARHEASRAAALLTKAVGAAVHVQGLVVTVNAADIKIKSQPDDVWVTWRNNLCKWILALGPILNDDVVEAIYEKARRSTTWTN